MPFVVRAFPVVRPLEELRAFLSTLLNERRAETDKFYGQYGVSHESAYLQEGPHGPQLIVVTILADEQEAAPLYAAASEEFHAWFKGEVFRLTGVDPNASPLGPATTEVYCWTAKGDGEKAVAVRAR